MFAVTSNVLEILEFMLSAIVSVDDFTLARCPPWRKPHQPVPAGCSGTPGPCKANESNQSPAKAAHPGCIPRIFPLVLTGQFSQPAALDSESADRHGDDVQVVEMIPVFVAPACPVPFPRDTCDVRHRAASCCRLPRLGGFGLPSSPGKCNVPRAVTTATLVREPWSQVRMS